MAPPGSKEGADASLEAARSALRERQGGGARYDSENAPARELDWARGGTAYFARKLNELDERDFRSPSLLQEWTKAELIAHVGYNARALTRLVEWARTGVESAMYLSPKQRNGEILLGGTLPTQALRNLFMHSEVHLSVEWRDLTDEQWEHEVRTAQGRIVPARETVWMRAKEVWVHTVDLGNGGSFADFPPELLLCLIDDVIAVWARRTEPVSLILELSDGDTRRIGEGGPIVTGRAADLAQWLTGRGAHGLSTPSSEALPEIPRWF